MPAIQRSVMALGACVLAAASMTSATTYAQSCFGVADLGGTVELGSPFGSSSLHHNFRGVYDPVTGHSHFFGIKSVNGNLGLSWWEWDGSVWIERSTAPITALFSQPMQGVFDVALDPTTRLAVIVMRDVPGHQSFEGKPYIFNIDDPHAAVTQFPANSAPIYATSVEWVGDAGAFYLFTPSLGEMWRYRPSDGSMDLVLGGLGTPGTTIPYTVWANVESVYDPATRRIVYIGWDTHTWKVGTLFFDIDTPSVTKGEGVQPPSGLDLNPYKMVRNADTGEVLLIGSRSNMGQPLSLEGVWRLSEHGEWEKMLQMELLDNKVFSRKPGVVYDPNAGQIVLFGGVIASDEVVVTQQQPVTITLGKPEFAVQPRSVVVPEGSPFSLMGIASTNSMYSQVRWFRNGSQIAMSAIPVLDFANATPDIAGEYVAMLRSACGSTYSETFHVTVVPGPDSCPGDTSGDGEVNFTDLNRVLANFGQACN